MAGTVKIAISLPREDFARIEKLRRQRRQSRSLAIREALRAWMDRESEADKVRRYIDGYRRFPEQDDPETRAWERLGLEALADAEWS